MRRNGMRPSPTNCSPPPPSIASATVHTASSLMAKPAASLGHIPTPRLRRVHGPARLPTPGLRYDRGRDGPVDLWTALLCRVPAFALARNPVDGPRTTCPSRKSVAVDFLDRLGEPHQATPWSFRLARIMKLIVCAFIAFLTTLLRSRLSLQIEIVALRHQLAVYERSARRPLIHPGDRILWSWISRYWSRWRDALMFVRPATVTAWQRKRFRDHWSKLGQRGKPGRPTVPEELKALIRTSLLAPILVGAHHASWPGRICASSELRWRSPRWRNIASAAIRTPRRGDRS